MGRHRTTVFGMGIAMAIGLMALVPPPTQAVGAAPQPRPESLPAGGQQWLRSVSAAAPDDVWAAGSSRQGDSERPLVEHWDGTSWSPVQTPHVRSNSRFNSISALSPNDVWAVGIANLILGPDRGYNGRTLVEHWDGSAWTRVPSANPSPVGTNALTSVIAIAADDVWAVGYRYYDDEEPPVALNEHWDGKRWTWIKPRLRIGWTSILWGVTATSPSDVWAVGENQDNWIQHWDGSEWRAFKAHGSARGLHDITAISDNDAWAVGGPQTMHWNGEGWQQIASPDIGQLHGVGASGPSDVWAVSGKRIEHWDGTTWSQVRAPGGGRRSAVEALTPSDAWVVGFGESAPLILHWDGNAWRVAPMSAAPTQG